MECSMLGRYDWHSPDESHLTIYAAKAPGDLDLDIDWDQRQGGRAECHQQNSAIYGYTQAKDIVRFKVQSYQSVDRVQQNSQPMLW